MGDRKSIRLKDYDYSLPGFYFVTICTHKHKALFGTIISGDSILNERGLIAQKHITLIPSQFENVSIDCVVVMPNHVHFIMQITCETIGAIHELPLQSINTLPVQTDPIERRRMLLPKIIGFYKMNVSKQIRLQIPASVIWQRNYYEHVIRNQEELHGMREYIQNNPLQWAEDQYYS